MRRTPCMGICSTTYGDLVCRGCKRFAHEIIQWNGFDDAQRRTVWERLIGLRDTCVRDVVNVGLRSDLDSACVARGLEVDPKSTAESLAYELLRRGLNEQQIVVDAKIDLGDNPSSIDALKSIDDLFLSRSQAHYERAFKTPVT